MIISGGTGQERLCEIRLADMGGRICYEDRLRFGNGVLSCSIPPLSQGGLSADDQRCGTRGVSPAIRFGGTPVNQTNMI
ncbi:hypothetical protein NXX53_13590 [Bacteroides salyersiae]|uniref:hypothetical protein n=1 Tax=Bacteroides salyersiae TaxID=291644 RepID=UPI002166A0E5|nr:hypothetical protein [Bacteroides salyersiae]MCS2957889.1 hypothetical protein [Bacteroides salyersiae]MCS3060815.1 hypothetical protein [Bacteroides salyersiae]